MTPESFFCEAVPGEWNRRASGPVSFSMAIRVGGSEGGRFHLRVEAGHMRASPEPAEDPIVTLLLGLTDWRQLVEQVGPSPMALLGGIGGEKDFALTAARLEALRDVEGTLRLEVTGTEPWGLMLHFGIEPIPDEPHTTLSIDAEDYRAVREGDLDLQGAFMTGRLGLDGDVDRAMRLALALMTPE